MEVINCTLISEKLLEHLKKFVDENIINKDKQIPKLVVMKVGDNESTCEFVKTLSNLCDACHISVLVKNFNDNVTKEQFIEYLKEFNNDKYVDGIVFTFSPTSDFIVDYSFINPLKDVNGFGLQSKYTSTLASLVERILNLKNVNIDDKKVFINEYECLQNKTIIELTRYFKNITFYTGQNKSILEDNYRSSDIIISLNGKANSINTCKKDAIIFDFGALDDNNKIANTIDNSILDNISFCTSIMGGSYLLTLTEICVNIVKSAFVNRC